MTTQKMYALMGINDEETACSHCGKMELKRVMWLAELDQDGNRGEVFPVGTTCGAKLLKRKHGEVLTAVKNFKDSIRAQQMEARRKHPLKPIIDEMENDWLKKVYASRERGQVELSPFGNPEKETISKMYATMNAEVDAMEFFVRL